MEIRYFFKHIFRGFSLPLNFLPCKQELFYLCVVRRPKDLQLDIFSLYLPLTSSNHDWYFLVWVWIFSATRKSRNHSSGCTYFSVSLTHVLLSVTISATDSNAFDFLDNSTKNYHLKYIAVASSVCFFLFLILARKSDKCVKNS